MLQIDIKPFRKRDWDCLYLQKIMDAADKDGSGGLNYEEFIRSLDMAV